ncbi:MAG: leucine-rich repeat domain-containing protein [Bacteroidales bacterium]|nr:leucine-rich repeat domain-containing protein [Bacteroidales bacterium]
MSKAVYKFNIPFKDWLETHSQFDEIVLSGEMPLDEFANMKLLCKQYGKIVDIADFHIRVEKSTMDLYKDWNWNEYRVIIAETEESTISQGKRFPLITALFLNKEFSHRFLIEKEFVYSDDKTMIAYIQNRKTDIFISEGIKIIGRFACSDQDMIKRLTLPDSVEIIGESAFNDCDNLKDVVLPKRMKIIEESAFEGCDIDVVNFPEGIEVASAFCFNYNFLEQINLPIGLQVIEDGAFRFSCAEEIIIPEGVERIEDENFMGTEKIIFPSTLREISRTFFYEEILPETAIKPQVFVNPQNPIFYSKNGKMYKYGQEEEYLVIRY